MVVDFASSLSHLRKDLGRQLQPFEIQKLCQRLGHSWRERILDGPYRDQSGRLQSSFSGLAFPFDQFQFHDLKGETEVVDVVGNALSGDLLAFIPHGGEAHRLEMVFQQD